MENTLSTLRDWLINDQHEYGEFGKHEIVNPTDLPRTFEMSQIKPNNILLLHFLNVVVLIITMYFDEVPYFGKIKKCIF